MEACVTFKTCGDTSKVAATLHRPSASLGRSCLWNSCCMFWVNMQRSTRTHLPNNSSASIRHQQQCKHGPAAGARSPEWAHKQQQTSTNSPVRNQWEQQTHLWRSDGGPGVVSGGRGHPLRLLWVKRNHEVSKHQLWRLFWSLNVASVVILEPDWLLWRRRHRQVRLVRLINNQGLILGEGGWSRHMLINRYFCKQSCDLLKYVGFMWS